jgi:hypothetical protein
MQKHKKKHPESCTAGRNEESWLKYLAAATLERAKTDLRWYLDLTGDSFD